MSFFTLQTEIPVTVTGPGGDKVEFNNMPELDKAIKDREAFLAKLRRIRRAAAELGGDPTPEPEPAKP